MGLFDFLKKPKTSSINSGMDLPPLPEMEGIGGFPELPKDSLPPLPDEALPPLPQMTAQPTRQAPPTQKIDLPPMDNLPPLPEMETPQEPEPMPQMEEVPMPPSMPAAPEFPEMPVTHDIIPDKIPPLEGIPEPPRNQIQKLKPEEIKKQEQKITIRSPAELPYVTFPEQEHETYHNIRTQQVRNMMRGPTFVKTETVKQVISNVEEVQAAFRGEDDVFFRITEVKNLQDKKYEKIRQSLEDMQRKLLFIDKTLFER